MPARQIPLIVCGPPNSGTSYVAAKLHACGLTMGDNFDAPDWGYPESRHEQQPLTSYLYGHLRDIRGNPAKLERAAEMLRRHFDRFEAVKIPSLAYQVRLVRHAFGGECEMIFVSRPFEEIAESIIKRIYSRERQSFAIAGAHRSVLDWKLHECRGKHMIHFNHARNNPVEAFGLLLDRLKWPRPKDWGPILGPEYAEGTTDGDQHRTL